MKVIFDTYIDNAMGDRKQADKRFTQFAYNYKKYFPINTDIRVLDIGIWRGEMLTCFRNWGYENSSWVDISPSTVAFCTSIGLRCELCSDTADWLNKQTGAFDIITLIDVLEHIPKDKTIAFIEALKNALKPNGKVIIQVPNLQSPDWQLHRYNDFTHEFGYIEHSLKQVLTVWWFNHIEFWGFEELCLGGIEEKISKFLRKIYYFFVFVTRHITRNINPKILNPVFFAVATKK